ncbi:MAG TPA: globin domain-containing protein [Phycisphaerales bacterium]|nr:globin domain-containing protein [Phycisphaerales bacterium]
MDSASRHMLRRNFRSLVPGLHALATSFYDILFRDHPELRRLFPSDLGQQKNYLMTALALVAKHVDNIAALEPSLRDLGRRHVGYGARPEHYPMVRDAALGALAAASGAEWTSELAAAWGEAIDTVSAAMLKGAAEAAGGTLAA